MGGVASILLVDDNPKILQDALPMYGYDVAVAKDGLEALKILGKEENNFDLILLDVMMPNMDGWDTLKAIRKKHIKYRLSASRCNDATNGRLGNTKSNSL